jgi:LCP family protein required for cell wall assembly
MLTLVILGLIGGYAGFLYRNSEFVRKHIVDVFHPPTMASEFPGVTQMNLMVIGRDYDYNNQDQVIRTHARSDMLMLAHIDIPTKTVHLLSIPRDTRAFIPGHGVSKINAAHAFGGPQLASQTVQENFGIPTDHYVALDFDGFQQAIDLLQGVDLTVDRKMDYDDNWGHLHIHLMPGPQHLNGEQAMGFVRFRHADSDLVRTQRQQALLAALKAKMVSVQTLKVLPQLLDTVDKHIDSDLTDQQKTALALFLQSVPKSNMDMQTVPSAEGGYYVETDWAQASPLIQSWFGVTPPMQHFATHHRRRRVREASNRL